MNALQTLARIDFYLDVSRNARFFFSDYNKAVNDAIHNYIDEKVGDEKQRNPENFQWIQQIRDDLFTLIAVATPSITNGTVRANRYYSSTPSHINFPPDYYAFVQLDTLIDAFWDYSRPITFNELGPLLKDSFKHPTNLKTYYNEDATGLTIHRGVGGTFTTAKLTYLRTPVDFSVGSEDQLIDEGTGVLTPGDDYIAVEVSVENTNTYQIGDQFTAGTADLTSGQVILASNTSPVDLPEKVHDEICKAASRIMLLVTSNYPAAQAVDSEVERS